MEITITTLCVATPFLIFLLSKLLRSRSKSPKFPPGPTPWPVIGNLNKMGPLPHRSIHNLSKQYGPLMQLRFGSFPVVIGSSVEMAEIFLKTMDNNFSDRPRNASGKCTDYNYSNCTWSPYGPYWRQARKMCLTELFSAGRVESFEYIRVEEVKSFLRETFVSSGTAIPLRERLGVLSLNVIIRMVMGIRARDSPTCPKDFKKLVDEWFFLHGVLNIGDSIPCLSFLDLEGYVKKMKNKMHEDFDRVFGEDMAHVHLDPANDPTLEVTLERRWVKALTQDLTVGGTESAAVTVEWAITELIKNPTLLKRAIDELDRVIGQTRWVEERDVPNLPYIEAVIKETMRLHPVAPLLAPRMTRGDCKVAGYDIRAGTRVFINTWTIGRDPKLWVDPEMFCPERFLGKDKDIDVKGKDLKLLPFGVGRRMCLGLNLGHKLIQSSLVNLLHGFNWKLPKAMSPDDLDMEETFGLSTPKKLPLVAIAEPRLPLHLYDSL